ncbi:hypothetical protein K1719_046661 [Acacia pycnantha]|nr:hypothetical protein K1719_046661 [Acacia pycnantha]
MDMNLYPDIISNKPKPRAPVLFLSSRNGEIGTVSVRNISEGRIRGWRIVERDPLSHPAFNYGHGKAGSRGEESSGWKQKHHSDDGRNQFQVSMSQSWDTL